MTEAKEFNQITLDVAKQWGANPQQVFALAESFISSKEQIPPQKIHEFLMNCSEMKLNPARKEVAAFYSGNKGLTCFTMIDGFITLANRHPMCNGWKFKYEYKDEKLIEVICVMYRKDRDHPTETPVRMSEWREAGGQWSKKPCWMLTLKALKHSCRFNFGYAGLYDDSEAKEIQGIPIERMVDVPLALENDEKPVIDILKMEPSEAPPEDEYRVQEAAAKQEQEHEAAMAAVPESLIVEGGEPDEPVTTSNAFDLEPLEKSGLTDEEKAQIEADEAAAAEEERACDD